MSSDKMKRQVDGKVKVVRSYRDGELYGKLLKIRVIVHNMLNTP